MAARVDDVARDDRVGLGERAVGRLLVAGLPRRAREVVALAGLVVADQRRVGVERLARVDDRGQRLVLDVDQRSASFAEYSSVAITNATSWPWKRTLSPASTACVS